MDGVRLLLDEAIEQHEPVGLRLVQQLGIGVVVLRMCGAGTTGFFRPTGTETLNAVVAREDRRILELLVGLRRTASSSASTSRRATRVERDDVRMNRLSRAVVGRNVIIVGSTLKTALAPDRATRRGDARRARSGHRRDQNKNSAATTRRPARARQVQCAEHATTQRRIGSSTSCRDRRVDRFSAYGGLRAPSVVYITTSHPMSEKLDDVPDPSSEEVC